MRNILKKSFYILSLLFGCIILLIGIGLILGSIFTFIYIVIQKLPETDIKTWIYGSCYAISFLLLTFLVSKSPDIISWSYKKLKK